MSTGVSFSAWQPHFYFPSTVTGIAVAGSTLLAVGAGGNALTSTDGTSWLGHVAPSTLPAGLTTWGTTFYAAAAGGVVLSTFDGTTWTTTPTPASTDLAAIATDGSTLVAVGGSGAIVYSSDGKSWQSATNPVAALDLRGLAYAGSQFIAVGYGGTILTSPDGITWTSRGSTTLTTNVLNAVASNASSFVAVGNGGTVLTSPDGVIWSQQAPFTTSTLSGVAASSAGFVAVGAAQSDADLTMLAFTSPDGVSWTSNDTGLFEEPFLAAANLDGISTPRAAAVHRSLPGWRKLDASARPRRSRRCLGTVYGAKRCRLERVRVRRRGWGRRAHVERRSCLDGAMDQSSVWNGPRRRGLGSGPRDADVRDGRKWSKRRLVRLQLPGRDHVDAAGNRYRILRRGGRLWGPSTGFTVVGDRFVSGTTSYSGMAQTSPDGITWTASSTAGTGIAASIGGLAYGAGLFVAVGGTPSPSASYTGAIFTSPDGATWTEQATPPGSGTLAPTAYGNNVYVAIDGQNNAVVASSDGITWTRHPLGTAFSAAMLGGALAFGDGVFLSSSLSTSTDGVTWTAPRPLPDVQNTNSGIFLGATYANNHWLAVGSFELILTHP